MLSKIRNRQKGFTLIELLIVVAIIGIIAALLIPNFLDALQKAKQKRTVADIRNIGTSMFSWLTDQVGAAAAGAAVTTANFDGPDTIQQGPLETLLVPQYIQQIPLKDGWKNDYHYRLNEGDKVLLASVMGIGSGGRGGTFAAGVYNVAAFNPTDYEQDIVWMDGFFCRWPQGAAGATAP